MQIISMQDIWICVSPILHDQMMKEKALWLLLIFKVLFLFINSVRKAQPKQKDKFKSHFLCNSAHFSKDLKCPIHQFCYLLA